MMMNASLDLILNKLRKYTFVRPCLLFTPNKCLKGYKSLGSLHKGVKFGIRKCCLCKEIKNIRYAQ